MNNYRLNGYRLKRQVANYAVMTAANAVKTAVKKTAEKGQCALIAVLLSLAVVVPSASADEQLAGSAAQTVNINVASAEEIASVLSGVGAAKARAIVAWREQHGGFEHLAELQEVKGIGQATVEKNKSRISLN